MKKEINNKKIITRIFLFAILTLTQADLFAQGNLMIFPSRVVFEGNKRYEVLGLTNVRADTATYALSFVQYRMNENGEFEQVTEPDSGQLFADPYLRFFPRQVVLGPEETQSVRVQVRKPANLAAGEYRSH